MPSRSPVYAALPAAATARCDDAPDLAAGVAGGLPGAVCGDAAAARPVTSRTGRTAWRHAVAAAAGDGRIQYLPRTDAADASGIAGSERDHRARDDLVHREPRLLVHQEPHALQHAVFRGIEEPVEGAAI